MICWANHIAHSDLIDAAKTSKESSESVEQNCFAGDKVGFGSKFDLRISLREDNTFSSDLVFILVMFYQCITKTSEGKNNYDKSAQRLKSEEQCKNDGCLSLQ